MAATRGHGRLASVMVVLVEASRGSSWGRQDSGRWRIEWEPCEGKEESEEGSEGASEGEWSCSCNCWRMMWRVRAQASTNCRVKDW